MNSDDLRVARVSVGWSTCDVSVYMVSQQRVLSHRKTRHELEEDNSRVLRRRMRLMVLVESLIGSEAYAELLQVSNVKMDFVASVRYQ